MKKYLPPVKFSYGWFLFLLMNYIGYAIYQRTIDPVFAILSGIGGFALCIQLYHNVENFRKTKFKLNIKKILIGISLIVLMGLIGNFARCGHLSYCIGF